MNDTIRHTAPLWPWTGGKSANAGNWFFVTIDGAVGEDLSALAAMRRLELGAARGFGSVKVRTRIGLTEWRTSCFPDKARGGWLLPVKAAIRKAEGLAGGDTATVELRIA